MMDSWMITPLLTMMYEITKYGAFRAVYGYLSLSAQYWRRI